MKKNKALFLDIMHTEIHVLSIVRDRIRGVIKVCSR